jgi:hypothetical protein
MKGKSYVQDSMTMDKVTFEDNRVTGNLEYCHNLITQVHPNPQEDIEYATMHAMLIARVMDNINSKVLIQGTSFVQQYILQKGLKVFGDQGREASTKEMDQLHRQSCFMPISIKEMMPEECKKAMEALMFLMEKHNQTIKGQMVYNGKPTREWLMREDSASPMAALESIMLTAVIDAHKECDTMTVDIPNAFIQTDAETQGRGRKSDHEDYRSASGNASAVETRIIWTLCGLQEWTKSIVCPSVESHLWHVTSLATLV